MDVICVSSLTLLRKIFADYTSLSFTTINRNYSEIEPNKDLKLIN